MQRYFRERFAAWIRRRQGADVLPVTLERRRLYVLPTRAGFGFALLLLVMLVAGLNYANSLAVFLTFLLAAFALVAMHQCHRNLLKLALLDVTARPSFAGRFGSVHLAFGNSARIVRHRIEASFPQAAAQMADVPAGGRASVELGIATPKRGILRIERMRLLTTHPFGLFRAWTWLHLPVELIVYPRASGLLPMPAEAGQHAGAQVGGTTGADEWLGLRPFRAGDSPRQVAWKAYARGSPLLVKEYTAAASDIRRFDFTRLAGLDTEGRLEQLARWIVDADACGERYGLSLPDVQIEPDHGPQHRHRCLTALARHGQETHGSAQPG